MHHHHILQELGIIFGLGIFAQWVAWKARFPVIILLLTLGVLAGPVLGLIHPRLLFGELLNPVIELAVAIILFEGGMSLKFYEFRSVGSGLKRLFSLAVVLHIFLATGVGIYLAGVDWQISLLIGSILVVTGPTVIIPALREAKLERRVAQYMRWEGIVNDPIGAMIAVLVFNFIAQGHTAPILIFWDIVKVSAISLSIAIGMRYFVVWAEARALIPHFLKVPFFITVTLVLYILAELLQRGAGLMTATLLGIALGNTNAKVMKDLRRFEESVAVFMVSIIFIILAATLDVSVWTELGPRHYFYILLLAFVLRPIAILLSTVKSGVTRKERLLIGLYGPRGIVAASVAGVVGAGLVEAGYDEGKIAMPIVFSVIILTVVVHSLWLKPLARLLGLRSSGQNGILIVGASFWSVQLAKKLQAMGIPAMLSDPSWRKLAPARRLGIATHYGKILRDIERGEPDLTPYGHMFAFTDDDAYNALLVSRFEHELGSDHTYQLPSHEEGLSEEFDTQTSELGRVAASDEALYENMVKRFHQGWVFKSASITEKYPFELFKREQEGRESFIFLVARASGRVEFITGRELAQPQPGDKVVYYAKEI